MLLPSSNDQIELLVIVYGNTVRFHSLYCTFTGIRMVFNPLEAFQEEYQCDPFKTKFSAETLY